MIQQTSDSVMDINVSSNNLNHKQNILVKDLGVIDFRSAWEVQEKIFNNIISIKINNRNLPEAEQQQTQHEFILCEHPAVITLGKNGSMKNLLLSQDGLNEKRISFFKINRGGDITYHGPGQLVGYPIIDLDYYFTDIGKYLRLIEETIILTLKDYHIEAGRSKGETGVWLQPDSPFKARKICAIGIRCSRWVTMHGFAFNINTDLSHFEYIIPCGIQNKAVTSLEKELGRKVDMNEVKFKIKKYFAQLFNSTLTEV